MKIKVVEPLSTITAAVAAQDVDKLLELKAKLRAVDIYIQAPNVEAQGFIQLINVILELLPDVPDLGWPETKLEYASVRQRVVAFNVGLVLFHIADAVGKRDRADLRQVQVDLQSIEELIYGKLNEPPSVFVKLIDAILEILPDAEVKTEPVKRIEEPLPAPAAPTAEKRSLAARLWKN